jgi:hypothetical protein
MRPQLVLSARQEFDLLEACEPDQVLLLLRESVPELIQKLQRSQQYRFVADNVLVAKSVGLRAIEDLVLYNTIVLALGGTVIESLAWGNFLQDLKDNLSDFRTLVSGLNIDSIKVES